MRCTWSDVVSFVGRAAASDRTQFANDRRPNSKWIRDKMEFVGVFDRQAQMWPASGKAGSSTQAVSLHCVLSALWTQRFISRFCVAVG